MLLYSSNAVKFVKTYLLLPSSYHPTHPVLAPALLNSCAAHSARDKLGGKLPCNLPSSSVVTLLKIDMIVLNVD